jgi:methyl-accepting chemotaxis protein
MITNKIAGPIFVIKREIAKLGAGDLSARIRLRDKDMFIADAQEMNASLEALRARIARVKEIAGEMQAQDPDVSDGRNLVATLQAELDQITTE